MLNIGAGEIAVILVVALLILGPTRLPEMARMIGKFVRELRRQTDDVRVMVEREFYRMDEEISDQLDPRLRPPAPPSSPAPSPTPSPLPPGAPRARGTFEVRPPADPLGAVASDSEEETQH